MRSEDEIKNKIEKIKQGSFTKWFNMGWSTWMGITGG